MTSPTTRLHELGIMLPVLRQPAGNYVHAVRTGRLLFLAGKGTGPYTGKVGRDVTLEQAYEYARATGIMLLAVMAQELGSLDKVTRIVKVTGFVNAIPKKGQPIENGTRGRAHPRTILLVRLRMHS